MHEALRGCGLTASVVGGQRIVSRFLQEPGASEKEIKAAYYRIMRACHPDVVVSLDEEDDGSDAQEVCVFVNDIYEVCSLHPCVVAADVLEHACECAAPLACMQALLLSMSTCMHPCVVIADHGLCRACRP